VGSSSFDVGLLLFVRLAVAFGLFSQLVLVPRGLCLLFSDFVHQFVGSVFQILILSPCKVGFGFGGLSSIRSGVLSSGLCSLPRCRCRLLGRCCLLLGSGCLAFCLCGFACCRLCSKASFLGFASCGLNCLFGGCFACFCSSGFRLCCCLSRLGPFCLFFGLGGFILSGCSFGSSLRNGVFGHHDCLIELLLLYLSDSL